ncbi:peptidoglycan DD-metalloendopeptidase family protein [bacterium]|nr:peptidoglycan DD-metalloendopeptidase family protein [bacterium]
MFQGCIPSPSGYRWYYVRRGDTLWSIARKNDADFFSLVNANGISNPSRIYPGMKLKVPAAGKIVSRKTAKSNQPSKKSKKNASAARRVASAASVSFKWPVKGKIVKNFGKSDLTRSLGIIIKADNPAVTASATGEVSFCGKAGNFGNTVIIKHASGYHTVYGYLDGIAVKAGSGIAGGDLIGRCGLDKNYGGEVLYFEIRFDTEAYDPMMYLE